MPKSTVKAIVSGLVQGVGFRYYIYREAKKLGVNGYARNLPSGQVEIMASGEKGMVDELIKAARIGPSFASVSGVAVEEVSDDETFNNFNIW